MDHSSSARFAEAYEKYYKNVHAYFRRRLDADHVDDAASETFLIAWKKIGKAPPGDSVLPWLYRIAYGVVTNHWRGSSRKRRLAHKLGGIGLDAPEVPHDVIVAQQESRQIVEALTTLNPGDQEILRLAVWEELSGEQIALVLDVSQMAARQRLSRARGRLADAYNELESRPSGRSWFNSERSK